MKLSLTGMYTRVMTAQPGKQTRLKPAKKDLSGVAVSRVVEDELLTTRKVAEILGVSQERVRQFVREGRIATRMLEPIILVARAELEQFAQAPRVRTGRPRKSL